MIKKYITFLFKTLTLLFIYLINATTQLLANFISAIPHIIEALGDGIFTLLKHAALSLKHIIYFMIHNWRSIISFIINTADIMYLVIIESIIAAYEISKAVLVASSTSFMQLIINNPVSVIYGMLILVCILKPKYPLKLIKIISKPPCLIMNAAKKIIIKILSTAFVVCRFIYFNLNFYIQRTIFYLHTKLSHPELIQFGVGYLFTKATPATPYSGSSTYRNRDDSMSTQNLTT